jgi:hypothetical protein
MNEPTFPLDLHEVVDVLVIYRIEAERAFGS